MLALRSTYSVVVPPMSSLRRSRGLTLIELIMAMAILAILTAIAVPTFNGIMHGKQLVGQASEVASSFAFARMEAISRSKNVVMCGSNNGSDCNADWVDGWIIFVDHNGNNARDVDANPALDDELLRVEDKPLGNVTLEASAAGAAAITSLAFDFEGALAGLAAGVNPPVTFELCGDTSIQSDANEAHKSREITINNVGSASIEIGKVACP